MTELTTHIELDGPFFTKDPGKTLRGNITKMMGDLADEGEKIARDNLGRGSAGRARISLLNDRVADHVRGRVASLSGRRWLATAVISVNNAGLSADEGISLMAAASQVERQTHTFRSLYRDIRNARAILRADLTEGLE